MVQLSLLSCVRLYVCVYLLAFACASKCGHLTIMCVHALLFVYTDLFGFVLSKYVNIPMYNVCVCICLHKPGRASMS